MFRKGIIVFAIVVMAVTAGTAFGWVKDTCQQTIDGTWDVKIWGGESIGDQCWGQCSLVVASDGSITATGSFTDCLDQSSSITGGHLTISDGCVIEGVISTESGDINVVNGGIIGNTIYFYQAE